MLEYKTNGYSGYSVKYSPFYDSKIAAATSANFGLIGNGRLDILNLTSDGRIVAEKSFDTQDSLWDVAWSEAHANQLVVASGDGSIKLFDTTLVQYPIASWREHRREVLSVHWSGIERSTFVSSSWDGSIKLWDPEHHHASSIGTFFIGACVYAVQFSPHSPHLLSAVTEDARLVVLDLRLDNGADYNGAMTTRFALSADHSAMGAAEVLTCDWNKYREDVIATGATDALIRVWDLRFLQPRDGVEATTAAMAHADPPVAVLQGHEYAVRRVAWSPHSASVLLSGGYDMTCRVWSDGSHDVSALSASVLPPGIAAAARPSQLALMARHTEFVSGVDWTLFGEPGWCASCGWDGRVLVWDVKRLFGRPM